MAQRLIPSDTSMDWEMVKHAFLMGKAFEGLKMNASLEHEVTLGPSRNSRSLRLKFGKR